MKGDRKYARKTKVIEKEIIQELKEIKYLLQTIATSLEQTTESRINEVLDNQYGKLLGLLINRKEAYLMVKQKGLQYLKNIVRNHLLHNSN